MQRYFIENLNIENKTATIKGSDVHHILHVMRYTIDDVVIVCNKGTCYEAKITEISKTKISLCLIEEEKKNKPNYTIDLFQSLIRKDQFEYALQKSTELGIDNIYPLETSRSIINIKHQKRATKQDRWNKITKEASEQSHRQLQSTVQNIVSFDELDSLIDCYDIVLLAHTTSNQTLELQTIFNTSFQSIAIIIGPEGGFTDSEVTQLLEHNNVKAVSLGTRILRSETASSYILSVLDYELNRSEK